MRWTRARGDTPLGDPTQCGFFCFIDNGDALQPGSHKGRVSPIFSSQKRHRKVDKSTLITRNSHQEPSVYWPSIRRLSAVRQTQWTRKVHLKATFIFRTQNTLISCGLGFWFQCDADPPHMRIRRGFLDGAAYLQHFPCASLIAERQVNWKEY